MNNGVQNLITPLKSELPEMEHIHLQFEKRNSLQYEIEVQERKWKEKMVSNQLFQLMDRLKDLLLTPTGDDDCLERSGENEYLKTGSNKENF